MFRGFGVKGLGFIAREIHYLVPRLDWHDPRFYAIRSMTHRLRLGITWYHGLIGTTELMPDSSPP